MTKYELVIDNDEDVERIGVQFTLYLSAVLDDRFPGDENQEQWREAMATVVRIINEHVRTTRPQPNEPDE